MSTSPETWPETACEEIIAIWLAISLGMATFFNGVLFVGIVWTTYLSQEKNRNVRGKCAIYDIWIFQGFFCHRLQVNNILQMVRFEAEINMAYRSRPSRSNTIHAALRCDLDDLILERPSESIHYSFTVSSRIYIICSVEENTHHFSRLHNQRVALLLGFGFSVFRNIPMDDQGRLFTEFS